MTIGKQSYLLNGLDNTLAADVDNVQTTITVSDAGVLPTAVPFYLVINPFDDTGREYMLCTNVAGAVLTVDRELEGSEGDTHSTGNIVRFAWNKQHLDDLWNAIDSIAKNLSISPYTFRTAVDGTPDAGEWERDNVTVASVTELFFHEDDFLQEQHPNFFTGLRDGDVLVISSSVDDGQEQYTVTGPGVLASNVYTVPVKDGITSGTAFIDTLQTTVGAVFGRFLKLDQLIDVDVASKSDLDVLSWIEATQMWEARANNANKGIITLEYLYDANQDATPAAGDVSPNNATPASVTVLHVNETDANGDDVGFSLFNIAPGDVIRLVDKANSANFEEYTVVTNTDLGTTVDYAVTPTTDGGNIANNAPIWFYHLAVLPDLDTTYLRLDTANNPLTGPLNMGDNQLNLVADGTLDTDGVNKLQTEAYADAEAIEQAILRMRWTDAWAPGTYEAEDVSRDGEWTMVANKQTSDRPAPQPLGSPSFIYNGVGGTTNDLATDITFGNRYTVAVLSEIQAYRIFTVTGNEYSVWIVVDPLGLPIVEEVTEFVASSTGWVTINVPSRLISVGLVFDLIAVVHEPDPTPTVFTGDWDYITPQNLTAAGAGEVQHANGSAGIMNVSKTDNNAGDRSAELGALTTGDIIQYNEPTGTRYSIVSISDQGTYIAFGVAPAVQSAPDGVTSFGFETVVATPITYFEDVGYWGVTGQPVQGILQIEDGVVALNDTAYGTDVLAQEFSASADWDVLAVSGGSGGGGDGGGSAPNGLPVGGTVGQRLYKIDATDFNTGWKDMLHADLGDAASLPDAHHVKYTDAEAVQALDDADVYVQLVGDTMSGLLILSGDPSAALGAATKQYVDARDVLYLPLGGGTLSGFLTLHADPTNALHAATKQYVDGFASPTTTLGDLIKRGAAVDERFGIGAAEQVLTVNVGGTDLEWTTPVTGVTDHALLTNVLTDQHHTKYTDGEAVSANTGIWLSLGGGSMNGDQAIASQLVRNIVAAATEPVSPDIGLVWIDTS